MNPVTQTEDLTHTGSLTVATRFVHLTTNGSCDIHGITQELRSILDETGLEAGTMTVFAPGATGAVTTLEFEPGVVHDFQRLFDQIVAPSQHYQHNVLLGDGNGHSHVRAGLLGPSLVIPFAEGELMLGRWQEVCFVCFDNRPRDRKVVVQVMGV